MVGLSVSSSAVGGGLVEIACLEGSALNCLHGSTLGKTQLLYEKKWVDPGGGGGKGE